MKFAHLWKSYTTSVKQDMGKQGQKIYNSTFNHIKLGTCVYL